MVKVKGLGRGLDALLGGDDQPPSPESALRELPIDALQPGKYQPRSHMEPAALTELAESIKAQGVMQPILARPLESGRFEIIAGERRWRAARMAGLTTVPALIREIPDQQALAAALIENIQREDLNPIEEAFALARLKDEFELTHQQVADAVGKSRAMVTNLLRLISLEEEAKKLLEHGDLEMGHARALLALSSDKQIAAARTVVAKGLSVRQTEALVRDYEKEKPAKEIVREDPNVRQLLSDLSDRLGAPVQLKQEKGGKGKLVISYNSLDELDGILAHIK
jgi:ParB family transcriptional regulator, chromosome partitioning protein